MSSKAASRPRPVASGTPTDQHPSHTSRRRRSHGDYNERLEVVERVNAESRATTLYVPNYPVDTAVRHAALRAQDAHAWPRHDGAPYYRYQHLDVYFVRPDGNPMRPDDAVDQLRAVNDSTILTLRIAMGLWHLRRHDPHFCVQGSVAVRFEEILEWRGVKKHSRVDGAARRTDGWRPEMLDAVYEEFQRAARFYVRGVSDTWTRGKKHRYSIVAPYLRVAFVTREDEEGNTRIVGVLVAPGEWITTALEAGNYFLTPVTRSIFALNRHHEQHALRIALFLVERWRRLAKDRAYHMTITMEELLRESVIPVDTKNLTNRFAPQIERALATLAQKGIIGAYACVTPIDRQAHRHWGKAWLAAQWRISPPAMTLAALEAMVHGTIPSQAA